MNVRQLFHTPDDFSGGKPIHPAKSPEEKIWDEREGAVIVQNHNLRRIIVGLIAVCVVLAGGLVLQSLKATVVPYVVEVDGASGQVKNIASLQESSYTPKEIEIMYFLGQFISNTRSIPLDPVVYKERWNNAYLFLTKNAAQKMNAQVQAENVARQFGKKTVQVSITSILPLEGGSSYQVRWKEEEFVIGDGEKKTVPMSGIFTVTVIAPKDEATLMVNPLGIYFSDFNWAKDTVK